MVTDLSFSIKFSKYGYLPRITFNFIIYDTTMEQLSVERLKLEGITSALFFR